MGVGWRAPSRCRTLRATVERDRWIRLRERATGTSLERAETRPVRSAIDGGSTAATMGGVFRSEAVTQQTSNSTWSFSRRVGNYGLRSGAGVPPLRTHGGTGGQAEDSYDRHLVKCNCHLLGSKWRPGAQIRWHQEFDCLQLAWTEIERDSEWVVSLASTRTGKQYIERRYQRDELMHQGRATAGGAGLHPRHY